MPLLYKTNNKIFNGKILFFLFSLFSLIPFCSSLAQMSSDEENINKKFYVALNYYDNKEYEKALKNFQEIVYNINLNPKTTSSSLFIAKCQFAMNNFADASKSLSLFTNEYANSKYIEEARLLYANTLVEQKEYINSLNQICLLIEYTNSPSYNIAAREYGNYITQKHLSAFEVLNEIKNHTDAKARPFLKLTLAKLYLKEKNAFQAEQTLNELTKSHPKSEEFSEAVEMLKNISQLKKSNYDFGTLIGVVLPIVDDTVAEKLINPPMEILEGIKFAIDEYNFTANKKIGLLIRDSNRDKKKIEEIYSEFTENKNISVVLGPVFSDEVRYALDIFKDSNFPIISPTATDNDLISLNKNFYQANPDFSVRGKVMAQYIYFVENKKKIAVLSANSGYSQQETEAFIKEFQLLGGTIVIHETYESKSFQLDEPIAKIARVQRKIEGIYIPLSDKIDAPVILSQLHQRRITVNLYGNQDWFSANGLETSTSLSNKLTIISDYFIDYNNPGYKEFSAKFKEKTGISAERNALYGYDLAKYLLEVIDDKNFDSGSITSKILSEARSDGYHNNISFNKNRNNRFLNIIRFKDGIFELIDRFQSSNN
jgi:branched-chain amino acid transport system substrate-binding protein